MDVKLSERYVNQFTRVRTRTSLCFTSCSFSNFLMFFSKRSLFRKHEILRMSARSLMYRPRIGHLRLIFNEFKALCDVTPRFEETLFDENGANKLVNTRTVIKLLKLLASSRSNFQNCESGRLDITRGTFKTILFSLCCCANCCRFLWAPLNSARRAEKVFRGQSGDWQNRGCRGILAGALRTFLQRL